MKLNASLLALLITGLLTACGAPPTDGANGGDEVTPPAPACGDGTIDDGETCDDGNIVDGDGCDAACLEELPPPGPGDLTNYGDDNRPTLVVGFEDPFGAVSCAEDMATGTSLQSVASADDSGQVILLPSEDEAYQIALPAETETGYLTMEVPAWGAKITIYSHFSTQIEVSGEGFEPLGERQWTTDCAAESGMTQQKYVFHEWGAFQLAVESAADQAWMMAIHTNP
jgi:cysteine-rich repeat protein